MSDSEVSFQQSDDEGSDFAIVASPAAGKKKAAAVPAASKPKKAPAAKTTAAATKGKGKATSAAATKVSLFKAACEGVARLISPALIVEDHGSSSNEENKGATQVKEECSEQLDVRCRRCRYAFGQ
jgi:hypothetical protein